MLRNLIDELQTTCARKRFSNRLYLVRRHRGSHAASRENDAPQLQQDRGNNFEWQDILPPPAFINRSVLLSRKIRDATSQKTFATMEAEFSAPSRLNTMHPSTLASTS